MSALATTNGRMSAEENDIIVPNNMVKTPIQLTDHGIQLATFEDAWRLATAISQTPFAPRGLEKPASILIAILYGRSLGMDPIASLQNIAVINNKPSIYGDALKAVVLASKVHEYTQETIEGDGDTMVAICRSKRKDAPEEMMTRFSIEDAKLAGLWGKPGPWKQYPKRMLQMRARGFNYRDNFADVLRGISMIEELQDILESQPNRSRLDSVIDAAKNTANIPE